MSEDFLALNTDRELFREDNGASVGMSYYEPSLHVTKNGLIGINVGGEVFVKPLREWHRLATAERGDQPLPQEETT